MIGISRATAIDMFYCQIILNNGIPFTLTIPRNLPIRECMNDDSFNVLMSSGYAQAIQGDSYDIDGVFEQLEKK